MKAAVLNPYKEVNWQTVSTPSVKKGEVLIKVAYANICGSDQHIFQGEFHPRTQIPLIMGHEFSGVIEEIGEGVTGFVTGQPVVVDPIIWCGECPACKRGHHPACTSLKLVGIDLDGGFAEYISVPVNMVYALEKNISLKHASLIEVLSIGFHACNRAGVSEKRFCFNLGGRKSRSMHFASSQNSY